MHKIISRFTLWAAASLLGVSAMAQTEIHKYQPGISEAGITYFLPKTQLRVVVTAQKLITRRVNSAIMPNATCVLKT